MEVLLIEISRFISVEHPNRECGVGRSEIIFAIALEKLFNRRVANWFCMEARVLYSTGEGCIDVFMDAGCFIVLRGENAVL